MSLDFFGRIVRWQCLRGSQIRAIEDSKAYRSVIRLTFVISPFPKNQIEHGACERGLWEN